MSRFRIFILQTILLLITSFLIFSNWINTLFLKVDLEEKLRQCEKVYMDRSWRIYDPCADLRKDFQQIEQDTDNFFFKTSFITAIVIAFVAGDRALRAWRLRRACRSVPKATEFLRNLSHTERFCVVFRPFGSDGAVDLPLEGWSLGGIFRIRARSIEEMLGAVMTQTLGLTSYALVDPANGVLAAGFRYLSAGESDWRAVVQALLQRAAVVVLIFPPGKRTTPSVAWEVEAVIAAGLIGRFIIVLPPPGSRGYQTARESLLELSRKIPGLAQVWDKDVFLVWVGGAQDIRFWERPKKKTIFVQYKEYRDAFNEVAALIRAQGFVPRLAHTSF